MIFACGMCGGVIELAAAGGVVGLSAVLTQLWNRRMRFKTLFSDLRRRHELAVAENPAAPRKTRKDALYAALYGCKGLNP